ncbi:MAG: chromosomal replication initiator protein DnaA [Dehalococcoidales bacterium]|nr:chromosomal replication initiator protein DnaA [Dehalococcoidales bacterium]
METDSAHRTWEAALGELQLQVSKHNFQTWFGKTSGLSCEGNQFTIGVPNTFVTEYLDRNQRSLIEKTLIRITHRNITVIFKVISPDQNTAPTGDDRKEIPAAANPVSTMFNPKYTLDSFVVGGSNRLAYAAALGVAENPGHSYNPLFVCGGVGLGKTHLLHGIGHLVLAKNLRVHYASCEQFTNEFISAIQERQTKEFRNKYRNADVLMIDDIQFISGKEQTEECFFHTFNELHNANRQIIVTSDRPPKSLPRLADRLRSRFEWGLIVDIQPPDFETRLAILQAKAKQRGESIAPDTLELIARKIQQNIRELEGNLNRVIAYAQLLKTKATPDLATKALENIADKAPASATITPALLVEAVASSFQLSLNDLKGLKRDKETSLARQIAMYLIRHETNCPLAQIGKELGDRNPSTVSHACEKIAAEINLSPYLKRKVAAIRDQIFSG